MEVDVAVDRGCDLGENPLWHPTEERLYWSDMYNGCVYRCDPATDTDEKLYDGAYIGGFTFQADGTLLLFRKDGLVSVLDEGTIVTEREYDLPDEDEDVYFNDVIADPEGRVFVGSRYEDDRAGRLYRLDRDGELTKVDDGIGTANGLGFTLDREQLYFTDSGGFSGERERRILKYDYDRNSGDISNRRTFVTVPTDGGLPDGMTVDSEGYVWSAHAFDHTVVRYTPDGAKDRRIEFPVGLVTSLTFGGSDYDTLFVTSGGGEDKEKYGEDAGAVFQLDPPVEGLPEFQSRIDL